MGTTASAHAGGTPGTRVCDTSGDPSNQNGRFIQRARVFVNSNLREPLESKDGWTFTVVMPEEIHNVVAIELYQFNVPRDAGPTFSGSYDYEKALYGDFKPQQTRSTAKTPVLLSLPDEVGTPSFQIIGNTDPQSVNVAGVVGPVADYILPDGQTVQLINLVDWTIKADIAGITPAALSDYSIEYGLFPYTRVNQRLYSTVNPGRYGEIRYEYKTGRVNPEESTANVLGFHPYRDTSLDANEYLIGDYIMNLRPFRYMDVFVDEIDELQPVARIPLVNEKDDNYVSSANDNPPHAPRILIRTVERLRKMHIRCRLAGGIYPPTFADVGMDLVFDVYSLAPIQRMPDWLNGKQNFAI